MKDRFELIHFVKFAPANRLGGTVNIPGPQAEILFFLSVEDERDLKT